jgi:hypothetical protein
MSLLLKCNEAKIEASKYNEFTIECEKINSIVGDIDDVLYHFEVGDIAKYKHILNVVECLDEEVILKNIDSDTILEFISKDETLSQKIVEMVADRFIINQARKLKIEKLLENER